MAICDFDIKSKDQRRPCWVNGRRAMFHRWTDSARPVKPRGLEEDELADHYQLHSVHALVEYEDGTMERVWPHRVQFVPDPQDWHPAAWNLYEQERDGLPFGYEEEKAPETPNDCIKITRPGQSGRHCLNCAHQDENAEFCEGAGYLCDKCTVIRCICKRCEDLSEWEPREGVL